MNYFTKRFYLFVCAIAAMILLYSCEKEGNEEEPSPIKVENVILDKNEINLAVGDKQTITASLSPTDATNKNVVWASSKPDVVKINPSGSSLSVEVTAVSEGEATVTVTTQDGQKVASCIITVEKKVVNVENVDLNLDELVVFIGENATLNATVSPADATNKNVTWSSSNPNIVTISQSGLSAEVKAVSEGASTITVTTEDGQKTATCIITVEKKVINVENVVLSHEELIIGIGENATLSATILPEDATNKNVSWSSNDTEIATIDEYGVVTGVSDGVVTISAISEDGGKTASCKVFVIGGIEADTQQLNDLEDEYW